MKIFLFFSFLVFLNAGAAFCFEADGNPASTETLKDQFDREEITDGAGFMIQESDEDIISVVEDFIRKDVQLKGSFLIEDKSQNKILKLEFESIEKTVKTLEDGARVVKTVFNDASGGKTKVFFYLSRAQWGGIDIFQIELKKEAKKQKSKEVKK
ncbi:MAG: hypothetical protein HY746_02630 [Elusimicrobia bacterium]|nr:hypothetical protein [Elusimicrobiota bacterium]